MATHEFVMIGDVDNSAAEAVRDFAKAQGFRVFQAKGAVQPEVLLRIRSITSDAVLPTPTWSEAELPSIRLPERMELNGDYPKLVGKVLAAYRITTAADLTQITFADFMRPELGWDSGRRYYKAMVLEFMIKNGIRFSDLNPAAAFPSDLERMNDELTIRTINCLARDGIRRLEMLVYSTAEDLLDLRNFGTASLVEVKASMTRRNIALKES